MKKRSILTMVVSLVLVGVISVGATMAYLTSTKTATNTFTIGNVKVALSEGEWDSTASHPIYPGLSYAKTPVVTNTGANECYVRIKVTGIDALEAAGFEVPGLAGSGWTKVSDGSSAKDGTYIYDTKLATSGTGAATSALFTAVSLPATVKIVDGKLPDGTDVNTGSTPIDKLLTVKAEAIQADSFGTAAEAFSAADNNGDFA